MWTCPECGENLEDQFKGACWKCANDGVEIVQRILSPSECIRGLKLSTTPFVPGHDIEESLGLVSGVAMIAENIISERIDAVIGDRAQTYETHFKFAQDGAIGKMALEAKARGANGIVGINLSYHNIRETMLMVGASGTAVTISNEKD